MLSNLKRFFLVVSAVVLSAFAPAVMAGTPGCTGKMWNPLTDLDYRLMGGIRIAGLPLMKDPSNLGKPPKHKTNPICFCKDGLKTGFGLGLTFWLPSYINDVARQAGCLGFLDGINILPGFMSLSSGQEYNQHKKAADGVTNMQIHWAYADITSIAGKSLFEKCNAMTGSMKITYLTEVDFIFQNDVYSAIMTPQISILASNAMLSQMACGFESIANTLGDWRDIGVCGWQGTRLPFTGNTIGKDSAQVSNMDITLKYLTRSALLGTTMRTMGDDAVCKPKYSAFYDPFQHRYQWAYPGKVSTRYNVNVVRWGLFVKDKGQGDMLNLASDASKLSTVDATQASANGGAMGLAQSVLNRLPKPLHYPTKEAGYMQVWEAKQCCLMVLTIENVLKMVIENVVTMGGPAIQNLYEMYNMANTVYQVVTDPIGAAFGAVGDWIAGSLEGAVDGISESLKGMV